MKGPVPPKSPAIFATKPVMLGGAPNITGYVGAPSGTSAFGPTNGALYTDANRSSYDPRYAASNAAYPRLYLDASRLSSIYGTAEVVQPSAIYTLACIKF